MSFIESQVFGHPFFLKKGMFPEGNAASPVAGFGGCVINHRNMTAFVL